MSAFGEDLSLKHFKEYSEFITCQGSVLVRVIGKSGYQGRKGQYEKNNVTQLTVKFF